MRSRHGSGGPRVRRLARRTIPRAPGIVPRSRRTRRRGESAGTGSGAESPLLTPAIRETASTVTASGAGLRGELDFGRNQATADFIRGLLPMMRFSHGSEIPYGWIVCLEVTSTQAYGLFAKLKTVRTDCWCALRIGERGEAYVPEGLPSGSKEVWFIAGGIRATGSDSPDRRGGRPRGGGGLARVRGSAG